MISVFDCEFCRTREARHGVHPAPRTFWARGRVGDERCVRGGCVKRPTAVSQVGNRARIPCNTVARVHGWKSGELGGNRCRNASRDTSAHGQAVEHAVKPDWRPQTACCVV